MASEERFGYEWKKYKNIEAQYELQFKNWVSPLGPADFSGKKVLDAGCGMGRNSYFALKWGAGGLSAFDLDERSVESAKENIKSFSQAKVFKKSIYEIDWKNEFDIAISIGVIHHLKDPGLALKKMYEAIKPGGTLLIWVYSYEGNEWITRLVDPVRKNITSKLPVSLVHFLSYFCSVPLWLFLKAYRGGNQYLKQLAGFKFFHVHSIVFDQLIPEVANYWTKYEAESLLANAGLKDIRIFRPPNNCGWTVIGIK
ncbi:MAG: class I SAM-dependent methyltransferase [Patescibacteria group bacterium]|jgi:SAM-dependent methyltransferase